VRIGESWLGLGRTDGEGGGGGGGGGGEEGGESLSATIYKRQYFKDTLLSCFKRPTIRTCQVLSRVSQSFTKGQFLRQLIETEKE